MATVDELQSALDKIHKLSQSECRGVSDRRKILGEIYSEYKKVMDIPNYLPPKEKRVNMSSGRMSKKPEGPSVRDHIYGKGQEGSAEYEW